MVVSTVYELESFVASILIGILTGSIYDIFRSIRYVSGKDTPSDFVMWLFIIASSAFLWYKFQNGEIRWYMLVGASVSILLYFLTISRIVFCIFYFLVRKIYSFFNIFFKLLLTPIKFLCKMVSVYIKKAKTKFSKKVEDKNYEEKACI